MHIEYHLYARCEVDSIIIVHWWKSTFVSNMKVVLSRELKSCPIFINLKTLSLGEWCMDAEFDALVFLLQRSPNLERLFLEPQLVRLLWLICRVPSMRACFNRFHCSAKRTSILGRHWKVVLNLREDHLLVKTCKWWRSDARRTMRESICWHICSGLMAYPLIRFMSIGLGALVSQTVSSWHFVFICIISIKLPIYLLFNWSMQR